MALGADIPSMIAKIRLLFHGRANVHIDGNMGGSFLVGSASRKALLRREWN